MFKLGLFVMLGFLALAASIIWVGGQTSVRGGRNYVAYFAESVQGLEVGSAVKYQGVDVGRIVSINVAPDPTLIEVVLAINAEEALGKSVMAGIALRGITGLGYIELVPQEADAVAKSPKIDFPTPFPVIPTYSRGISQVISSIGTTLDKLSQVDFVGLSKQAAQLMASVQRVMDNDIKNILDNFAQTGKNLQAFSADLADMSRQIQNKRIIEQLAGTVDNVYSAMANLRQQIDSLALGQMGIEVSAYIEEMGRTLSQLSQNLTEISENLAYVFSNLEALSDRLARTPSDALFSQPPPPLPEERRR